MKIKEEILKLLDDCTIKCGGGLNIAYLPSMQLDRNTYLAVNKCLESIGGKWNRKEKGHIFEANPTDLFENLLITGEVEDIKKEFQFFETSKGIAQKMIEMADLKNTDIVFEPSAGRGAIAIEIKTNFLFLNELNKANYEVLKQTYDEPRLSNKDFLTIADETYDKIIMNPPFSKQQDIDHIYHAFNLLRDRGILVSIVSESPFFRTNKKSVEFRNFLNENNAEIIKNDIGAFKDSGTLVNTRIIKLCK